MLNDKHIVDWFSMPDAVSAMRFGKFGREDSSLVLITVGGSLTVKILRRTAQFENMEAAAVVMGPNARQVEFNKLKELATCNYNVQTVRIVSSFFGLISV